MKALVSVKLLLLVVMLLVLGCDEEAEGPDAGDGADAAVMVDAGGDGGTDAGAADAGCLGAGAECVQPFYCCSGRCLTTSDGINECR